MITLSHGDDDKVVGVILGDYRNYLFTLSFECVAEHMRRKGLGALLYKASDTVIQCLCRDKAMRQELPTTNDILVVAYTEPGAPLWVKEFVEKAGFAMVEPYTPESNIDDRTRTGTCMTGAAVCAASSTRGTSAWSTEVYAC